MLANENENDRLQQALAPLIKSVDELKLQARLLSERLDKLPDTYLTKGEYHYHHSALEDGVKLMQASYVQEKQWANDQHASIRAEFVAEVKALRAERQQGLDTQNAAIEKLRESMENNIKDMQGNMVTQKRWTVNTFLTCCAVAASIVVPIVIAIITHVK